MPRPISVAALHAAAALALLTGVLPADDARGVLARIWSILVFLAAVTVLAELSDDAGLFDLAAAQAARLGRGSVVRLWLLVVVLAVLTTTLLSLDTTAVLLTPVVLALVSTLDLPLVPFAMTTVWLANTGSLLLPVANLTNLLAVQRLGWSAAQWATRLWVPALVAVAVTGLVLWALHRRDLRGRYAVPARPPVADRALVVVAGVCCAGLGAAVAVGVPAWAAAGTGAAVLVVAFAVRRPAALTGGAVDRLLPWRLVLSTTALFLVVAAAERHGLARILSDLAGAGGAGPVDLLRMAGVGALGSTVVNNLPAYLAVEPAVGPIGGDDGPLRLLALLVGTNVGPLVTVWASLATVLWRERCRARGVTIGAGRFAAQGLAVVIPAVTLTVLSLSVTSR